MKIFINLQFVVKYGIVLFFFLCSFFMGGLKLFLKFVYFYFVKIFKCLLFKYFDIQEFSVVMFIYILNWKF